METRYSNLSTAGDWPGFSTTSYSLTSTQEAVISEMITAAIPGGPWILLNKDGREIIPKRLDLFMSFAWKAHSSDDTLKGKNGKFPPPWVLVECSVYQTVKNEITGSSGSTSNVPTDSEFSSIMWLNSDYYSRNIRPWWISPTEGGLISQKKSWKLLYKKMYKFKCPYQPPRIPVVNTEVIAAGIPGAVVAGAYCVQPYGAYSGASMEQSVATSSYYKSIDLSKCLPIKFDTNAGAVVDVTQNNIWMAFRFWHSQSQDWITSPLGAVGSDFYVPVTCSVRHRFTYKA